MSIKKEIIRLYIAPWKISFALEYENLKHKKVNDVLLLYTHNQILQNYCNEVIQYEDLLLSYQKAIETLKSNNHFVWTYKVNSKYNVAISDTIDIYFVSHKLRFNREKLFPWDYPSCIFTIGYKKGYSVKEIISDLKKLNYVSFFKKYYLNIDKSKDEEDILRIIIDSHITFELLDEQEKKSIYVADAWYYNEEEILYDLNNLSLIDFGDKYKAIWSQT